MANRVAKIIGCRAREVSGSVAEGVLTVDVVLIVDADSRAPQLWYSSLVLLRGFIVHGCPTGTCR